MKLNLAYYLLLTVILLTSCNSSKSIRLKDISDSQRDDLSNLEISKQIKTATIVHIDKKQRVITIRCTCPIEHGGYYTTHSELGNKQNSIIKVYDSSYESIFIADILEGTPKITDSISRVSEEKSKELDAYFTEPTID